MKIHPRFLPCLTLSLGLFTTGPASAFTIDLANNLAETPGGSSAIDNLHWTGQQFQTTGSAYIINYVAIPLSRSSHSSAGNFELDIYDDGLTTQVAVVFNSPLTALGTTSVLFEVPNLNIVLNPATSYYLVLKGIGMAETAPDESTLGGTVYWDYTTALAGTGFPSGYVSFEGGTPSAPDFTDPQLMRIQAVPEPSTFGLLGIGLAATGFATRRPKSSIA